MSRLAIKAIQAAAGGAGAEPREATFSDVVLLMDGDGQNGGDNDDITDGDGSSSPVSQNGTKYQGTFSPYGDNWSVDFNGTSDYLRSSSTSVSVGTGDFTLECWALSKDSTQTAVLFDTRGGSANNKPALVINNGAFAYWSTSHRITAPVAAIENVWFHVAIVRYNNTTTLYIDGEPKGTYSDSANVSSITRYQLGAEDDGNVAGYFDGYISNVRFSATSRYTSSFTPSTSPFTNDGSTNFLACASNGFKDKSSSSLTFTATGTPKISPSSPFRNSSARTLTNNGGSIEFPTTPNNTNYFYVSQQIGTDTTFTCEGWIYMTDNPRDSAGITGFWSTGDSLSNVNYGPSFGPDQNRKLRMRWWLGYGAECEGSTNMNLFEWYHICLTISGSSIYFFVNGQSESLSGTTSYSQPIGSSSYDVIGADSYGTFKGYISDFRLSSSAQRTSNFTPPTSPVSAFSNSRLLFNFRDAQIIDLTGLNNIRTVGTQVSNSPKKYGTGSINIGNNDYLEIPSNDALAMGTGDFTIETWAWVLSTLQTEGSQDGVIIELRSTGGTANGFVFNCRPYSAGFRLNFYTNGSANTGSITSSYSTWHHLAVTRESGTVRLFVNGTEDVSFTKTNDFSDTPTVRLGTSAIYSSSTMPGYLDDFRITRGVARYISDFTPPTAALPKY